MLVIVGSLSFKEITPSEKKYLKYVVHRLACEDGGCEPFVCEDVSYHMPLWTDNARPTDLEHRGGIVIFKG